MVLGGIMRELFSELLFCLTGNTEGEGGVEKSQVHDV